MNGNILLIEDEIELQQNLKEILEYNGFSIVTADHGQEGLEVLEAQEVDLILCDIMMPVMDGYQFLKQIRTQPRFQHVPFIFLSAKASRDDKSKGLAEGANDYLTKPISARLLLNSVFALLSGRKCNESLIAVSPQLESEMRGELVFSEENTPISGLIQLLTQQQKALESEQWKEANKLNLQAMTQVSNIHHSFGKIPIFKKLGTLLPKPSRIFLNDLIFDLVNELGPEKFVFRSRPSQNVIFDAEQMGFVLQELLQNALKFNQNPAPVEIEWFSNELLIKNKQTLFNAPVTLNIQAFCCPHGVRSAYQGLGLGLFIVSEYCKLNAAYLECTVDQNGAFLAKIQFLGS